VVDGLEEVPVPWRGQQIVEKIVEKIVATKRLG
jgi:hypothetical protein